MTGCYIIYLFSMCLKCIIIKKMFTFKIYNKVGEINQRRQWYPTPVLLPGKSHGWRCLVGCSPWGRQESGTTEWLHFTFHFHALEKEMATHSSVLAWRIPGTGSLVGCCLWGCTGWSDLAAAAGEINTHNYNIKIVTLTVYFKINFYF